MRIAIKELTVISEDGKEYRWWGTGSVNEIVTDVRPSISGEIKYVDVTLSVENLATLISDGGEDVDASSIS